MKKVFAFFWLIIYSSFTHAFFDNAQQLAGSFTDVGDVVMNSNGDALLLEHAQNTCALTITPYSLANGIGTRANLNSSGSIM